MNILEIAEEYYLVTFTVVIGIGLLQGAIIGRGIRSRFPSFKKHARAASIILLALFINSGVIACLAAFLSDLISVFKDPDFRSKSNFIPFKRPMY